MTNELPVHVLDSFAVLAFFQAEPGGLRVRSLFEQSQGGEVRLLMSVVNLGEVVHKTMKRFGSERADEILGALLIEYDIEFVDIDRNLALRGAQIKGVYSMSYADCIAAALALRERASLVTGDPEFRHLEQSISIEWLPQPEQH